VKSSQYNGISSALGAALLFGASTPLAKLAVSSASPVLIAGLLYLGSGVGLAVLRMLHTATGVRQAETLLRGKTCRGWPEPSSQAVWPGQLFCCWACWKTEADGPSTSVPTMLSKRLPKKGDARKCQNCPVRQNSKGHPGRRAICSRDQAALARLHFQL
jgi:hypothetical protein